MGKLNVVIMGQNCEKFIGMCLESVKDADNIIYCDGGSTDETLTIVRESYVKIIQDNTNLPLEFGKVIQNQYDQEDPKMNGKQRNFYLDHLKKHHMDEWALILDADEILEDLSKVRELINSGLSDNIGTISVNMRHLIGDLGHEDATQPVHRVLSRLFKVGNVDKYPEVEHPVLQAKKGFVNAITDCTTIWHMAYCGFMWDIKKRYENHLKKSNMHTPEYLKSWRDAHIFGTYPRTAFNPVELPEVILKEFGVDKDELYFKNRGLETNHFIDAVHWKEFFKCKIAIEWGCGRGPRVYAMNNIGILTEGYELSEYAVKNKLHDLVSRGNIY